MNAVPIAFTLLALAAAAAQDAPTDKDGADARRARLAKALQKMAALPSLAFTSKETGGGMDVIRVGGARPAPTEVSGRQADGLLHVTCAGDQEVLLGGRRMLARGGAGEAWKLRAAKTASGNPLPFLFDPQTFFTVLRDLNPEVARAEVGAWQDQPIEVFSVTLDGDAARELVWGGLVPEASGFGSMVVMRVAGAVGAAGAGVPVLPPPALKVDLAFFVDPASDLVRRLRVRVTDEGGGVLGGRVVFAAGGGVAIGGEEEEEEEETDEQKPKGTTWKDGLPVRKGKNRKGAAGEATSTLDVEFRDFEKAALPELDEKARALLGRPAPK
jgi:hypothetical protein